MRATFSKRVLGFAIALVLLLCAFGVLRAANGKPPAAQPIVLHYRDAPIILGPHEHWVHAAAFSPDGKSIATGSGDGYLRLWDAATGRLKSMHGNDAMRGINGLAFSPDGSLVAVVGAFFGKDVVVWDVDAGRIALEIDSLPVANVNADPSAAEMIYKGKPIDFRPLNAVAFSPGGHILATAGQRVILRDAQSGKLLATLDHPAKNVKAMVFSRDGKRLLTGADDGKVRLWNVAGRSLEQTLAGPTQPINAIAISRDGQRIVATSSGNRSLLNRTLAGHVWLWDKPEGAPKKIELGEVDVQQVAFDSPASVIVAAGSDVLAVDLRSDQSTAPKKIWSHSANVLAVAVSPNGESCITAGRDRTADVVDLKARKLVHRLPALNDSISAVDASSDGKRFATATIDARFTNRMTDKESSFAARYRTYFSGESNALRLQSGEVRVWSAEDGRMQWKLPLAGIQVTAVRFLPGGRLIAVGGWSHEKGGHLSLWDGGSGKHVRDFAARKAEVLSIAASPDGHTLAASDADGNIDFWNVSSGEKIRSQKQDRAVEAVTFSKDGNLLAAADDNQTVRIFNAADGKLERTLSSRSLVEQLDFSPDGSLLAAGTRKPGLELWNLRAGGPSRTLIASGDYFDTMPGFVAFSHDGRFVACGGHGKDIAVFDAAKGELYCELRGHFHAATAAVFLPDGRLLSGAEERTVRIWDVAHRTQQAVWIAMPADSKQGWEDEWVGFVPGGAFVGSTPLRRLIGWQSRGEVIDTPQNARHRLVDNLFQAQ